MVESTSASARKGVIPISRDDLNFKNDAVIMGLLAQTPGELIVFSTKVIKYNKWGMKQERDLLLTTEKLYNIKKKEVQRSIPIKHMLACTKSTAAKEQEFVVHVKSEYDYQFICPARDELITSLKAVYFHKQNANMPMYGYNEALKKICTSKKDAGNNKDVLPPDSFLLEDENVFEPIDSNSNSATNLSTQDSSDSDLEFLMHTTGGQHRATFAKNGDTQTSLADFEIKKVIGRGSFGKVFLVQKKDSGEVFAMKTLRKDVIIDYDQVESTKLEKDILLQADHPFLVGMNYVFMTGEKIFFVMRFVRGGELFSHLRQAQRFTEERAKFYTIQVALAIGHLHNRNIIYRDLKPENILMDENGYLCVTDFGLAKVLEGGAQAYSFCGTPDYLAPEILNEKGHSFPVDWWALGILTYEMIVGFPPFYTGNKNNSKMYQLIKSKPVYFPDPQRHNIFMSDDCKDFITKLLMKDPNERLGQKGGIEEIKKHPWFADIDMEKLLKCKIAPPFKPECSSDPLDVSHFDEMFTNEEAMVSVVKASDKKKIEKHAGEFENFC